LFWRDPWVGEGVVLKDRFERLFLITTEEEVKVLDMCWEREGRAEKY
jgi:hypothetical protein